MINPYFCYGTTHQSRTNRSNMKKLLLISFIALLLFSPGTSECQNRFPLKLGLRVSPNLGWMSPGAKGYSADGASMGATIGFVSDFYFAENYAFSTGFNFLFLNGKMNYQDKRRIAGDSVSGSVNRKYNFLYLEIPLLMKMQTKIFGKVSFYGQIGFGTGFRLKTTVRENFQPLAGKATGEWKDNYSDSTALIRESILIGFGCEYHIDESSRIFIGLTYSNSLNNVMTGMNYQSKINEKSMLNFAELTVGILF